VSDIEDYVHQEIGSTPIRATPHVTAHWSDGRLTSIEVSNLEDGGELTWEQYRSAWAKAARLRREPALDDRTELRVPAAASGLPEEHR